MPAERPIIIATRGSALALAQVTAVLAQCRAAFPRLRFEQKIIKTTGDKLQSASLANPDASLPKGLFTKELEVALLKHQADIAVHSLKDLPVELPAGLTLGAVCKRADVRDVLIYRDAEFLAQQAAAETLVEWTPGQAERRGFKPHTKLKDFPPAATVATSSTRRRAQLLAARPDLKIVELRGNVPTRLQKLSDQAPLDAIVLAAAGLERLDFTIRPDGSLRGDAVPDGLLAIRLEPEEMLPAVGQGAVGIEVRDGDGRIAEICARLNHFNTHQCVLAERAFLLAMGGGCASPVGAYAQIAGHQVVLKVISFIGGTARRAEGRRPVKEAVELGEFLAAEVSGK
ncbi:MAG: hydroxymethylbilane synthase [Verrucomicrobia bacterium]|nr:hydroxymethylbilane synthase [Verrucomicrobiota bacterium]